MIERFLRRLPTPMNEARRFVAEAKEEGRKLREQREEVEEFVLTITLPDYAASKGKSPTDYELRGLHGFGSADSYYEAQTEALVSLNRRRIETGCEMVVGTNFNSVATTGHFSGTRNVEVGATGTGLRLKVK